MREGEDKLGLPQDYAFHLRTALTRGDDGVAWSAARKTDSLVVKYRAGNVAKCRSWIEGKRATRLDLD